MFDWKVVKFNKNYRNSKTNLILSWLSSELQSLAWHQNRLQASTFPLAASHACIQITVQHTHKTCISCRRQAAVDQKCFQMSLSTFFTNTAPVELSGLSKNQLNSLSRFGVTEPWPNLNFHTSHGLQGRLEVTQNIFSKLVRASLLMIRLQNIPTLMNCYQSHYAASCTTLSWLVKIRNYDKMNLSHCLLVLQK